MISALPSFPVSSTNQKAAFTLLDDDTGIPDSVTRIGGKAFTPAGSAYVCPYPSGGTAPQGVTFIGGRAIRVDGAQIVDDAGATATMIHGVAVTSTGALRYSTSEAIVTLVNGIPVNADGVVCAEVT